MIKISEYDPHLVADIVQFRRAAYTHSGRNSNHLDQWSADDFDQKAQRLRVPCEVLSSAVAPMGEDSFLVRFSVDELIRY